MGRTSIKNKLILSFLALLLIVMAVVGIVNRVSDDFYLALAISTAFAMAAGIIFGSIFSKSLVSRLLRLGNITKEISKGDLSKDIPLLSMDEIRDLEEAFSTMLNDLRRIILEMKNVSMQIQKTNTDLSELVNKVLSNSLEIDQSANDIAKGSEEQTLIVQKTSLRLENGITEMDEMVKQSAETVSKINEARAKTEKAEGNARRTINQMEDVLKQMVEYTQPMYRLANKVEKINLVINIMDEIAQKTDLLSLNASIEATRAGESGKGFALVADEIRSMAENSKRSSREIRKMVEDILDDNREVINALNQTQKGISDGRETIYGTLSMFGDMLTGVQDISAAVKVIEEVTAKQVTQLKGLSSHFQDLSRLASENFVSTQKTTVATKKQKQDMEQIVTAMKSLDSLSEKMMETQQRFKLGELEA
ncbi:MAG: methyl-accepting chemotaxis protein [Deltaproteobacteria bacterium]|nr:methyl-accepting chemotaxis protein [Deltaproteobacteria bacterium]